jgi:excisionase family DNA binding protein
MNHHQELLSVRQISNELGISESTIWRWSKLGIITAPIPIGRQRRWRRSTVDAIKSGAVTDASVESQRSIGND